MDGWIQIHGWLASRPANQPCIWIHPSIFGVYYWYWYIIGCMFPIMGGILLSMDGILRIMGCIFRINNNSWKLYKPLTCSATARGNIMLFIVFATRRSGQTFG